MKGNIKNNVWGEDMIKRPEVSIICCTYNDEQYIRDSLNSLLGQKTNFPIEILIHDDASTDNTAAIIREYEKVYPQIIKPIFQKDNQYSKGIDVQQINYERARGKYIAICNGSDYWIDEYKLQRQYDYLEKTKNCVLSVHAGKLIDVKGKYLNDLCAPSKMNKFYNTLELIKGESGLFATNSMFFRSSLVKSRPSLFMNTPVTDYVLILYLSLFGQVHYMRDVMSCHRVGVQEYRETAQIVSGETDKQHFQGIGEWLLLFDEWTNYSFHDSIEAKLNANGFIYTTKQNDYKEIDAMSLRQEYISVPSRSKLIVVLEQHLPQLAGMLKRKRLLMYQLRYRRNN